MYLQEQQVHAVFLRHQKYEKIVKSKGIDVAAVLGIVGGDPDMNLEVLESVTKEDLPVDIDFW